MRRRRDTVAGMLRAGALALAAAFVCAAPADGAYPGRNGRVAYVESALGRIGSGWGPTIVSVRLDGTGRQTLTTATRTSGDFEPAWSPDGRRLAYVHSTGRQLGPGTSGTEIWVMNADGSSKRRLTRNSLWDGSPTWSPDGRSILFVRGRLFVGRHEQPSADLWVMRADGRGQRRLTRTPELELDPAWAPRGDRLAFLVAPLTRSCNPRRCTVGRERELWTSAPDGTRRPGGGLGGDLIPSAPTWSPDGSRLAAGHPPRPDHRRRRRRRPAPARRRGRPRLVARRHAPRRHRPVRPRELPRAPGGHGRRPFVAADPQPRTGRRAADRPDAAGLAAAALAS